MEGVGERVLALSERRRRDERKDGKAKNKNGRRKKLKDYVEEGTKEVEGMAGGCVRRDRKTEEERKGKKRGEENKEVEAEVTREDEETKENRNNKEMGNMITKRRGGTTEVTNC